MGASSSRPVAPSTSAVAATAAEVKSSLLALNLRLPRLFSEGALESDAATSRLKLTQQEKLLTRVQRAIALEYPWLSNVYESMLVTDCSLPDCPIVYANDDFEKLSLYPKEEIVGRNCRFLQGPLTNRETVVKIREAVNSGRQMEVEILNYRKDGIPFWNNFLMLPVHKNPRRPETSRVLYFIAIQKDISVIKFTHLAPILWGPAEVALWFQYHSDWEQFAPAVIEQNVDGRTLLERLSDELLMSLGVMTRKKREEMKAAIDELRADPDAFLARYQQPANGGKVLLKDEIGVNEDPNLVRPRLRSLWRADEQDGIVAVKCYADNDTMVVLQVPKSISLRRLQRRINERLGFSAALSFKDADGDLLPLQSAENLEYAMSCRVGTTLHLQASSLMQAVPRRICRWLDWQVQPVVVVNPASGIVQFVNRAFEAEFQVSREDLLDRKAQGNLLPDDFAVSALRHGAILSTTVDERDAVMTVSMAPDRKFTQLHFVSTAKQVAINDDVVEIMCDDD